MKKNRRIIITGGSGFIGSFLVEKLIAKGFTNVIVQDKNPQPQPGGTFVQCDVFRDVALLKKYITEGSVVIHLACTTMPSVCENDTMTDAEKNIAGTLHLLNVCRDQKIGKFIFGSSGGTVYGNSGKKRNKEKDSTNPENSYGAIKLAIEKYLGVYQHLYGMKHVILRIANPYGRKRITHMKIGAVDIFLRQAMERKELVVWGDGKNVRDYIHIDDVIDFFIASIEKKEIEGIYNIGTGRGTSINQILNQISAILKHPVEVKYKDARGVDVRCNVLDIKKAKKTGWRPKYTVSKGIRAVYREILKN